MKLSIIVATHGDRRWENLAAERAIPSAERVADAHEVLHHHSDANNRAEVRNYLASQATGDWLCFLDADDELHWRYCRAMADAETKHALLTPAVQYVIHGKAQKPRFWPECDLRHGNWMVVGTVIEKVLFEHVGGWKTYMSTGKLNEYDDWSLWIRATRAGGVPTKVPRAIYIAHNENTSQHRHASGRQKKAWFDEIVKAEW